MSEPSKSSDRPNTNLMRPLRGRIARTRLIIAWERICVCFWPAFTWTLVAIAGFILRGVFPFGLWVSGIAALGAFWMVFRGMRNFKWPQLSQVYARLDLGLDGGPVRALADQLALGQGDAQSEDLWQTHLSRMAERAAFSTVPKAHVRLAQRDPFALRLLAILGCALAVIFVGASQNHVGGNGVQRLGVADTGPKFEIWAKPPLYTGLPTVYLNDVEQGQPISMAQGSEFLLRSYGDVTIDENLSVAGNTAFPTDENLLSEARFVMVQSGVLSMIDADGSTMSWDISVLSDLPPLIEAMGEITRDLQGAMQLPFRASDDYGVTGGDLTITLDLDRVDRRFGLALPPEDLPDLTGALPLPFNANTADFDGIVEEDFSKHLWAGLPVTVQLTATDAAQNVGRIIPLSDELARKRFFDPLAAALVDVRRQLMWNRENAERAVYLLRAITYKPEGTFNENKAYEMSRDAIGRLETYGHVDLASEVRDEVAELLWAAALLIEDGDLDDAKEQLRRAQERLNEAMENGATDAEIAELMQALRDATDKYMDELSKNAEQGEDQPSGQQGETITQDEIQEMMDEIQRLMEEGRMDEAQELLEKLQEMMENMQVVKQSGQGGESDEGNQTEQEMEDMLEDQQELADDTFQELQEQFNQQQQGQGNQQQSQNGNQDGDTTGENQGQGEQQGQQQGEEGPQSGQQQGGAQGQDQGENGAQPGSDQGQQGDVGSGRPGAGTSDLAGRQRALRQMLNNQRRNIPNDGSQSSKDAEEALKDADRQMGDAEDSLRKGDFGQALNQQSDALESLRRGMRAMRGQQQARNEQQNGDQSGSTQGASSDPLGRSTGQEQSGRSVNDDAENQGLDQERRRKKYDNLLNELKGRAQDRTRPEYELDYLERLLDRF